MNKRVISCHLLSGEELEKNTNWGLAMLLEDRLVEAMREMAKLAASNPDQAIELTLVCEVV